MSGPEGRTPIVQTKWTEEEDRRLQTLIASNRSAAQAAVELGRSRSSVLGRAFRLGIGFHGEGARTLRFFPGMAPKTGLDLRRLEQIELYREYRVEPDPTEDRSKARPFLEAMGRPVCTWFLKGEEGRRGLVCGHRALPGLSYCAHHKAKSIAPSEDGEAHADLPAMPAPVGAAA
jgi:GcrA cell cycle regulator